MISCPPVLFHNKAEEAARPGFVQPPGAAGCLLTALFRKVNIGLEIIAALLRAAQCSGGHLHVSC